MSNDFVSAHLAGEYASEVGSTIGSVCSSGSLNIGKRNRTAPPPLPSRSIAAIGSWPGSNGLLGLDAYSRHKKFINDYVLCYGKERAQLYMQAPATGKTDIEILRENYRYYLCYL
jgi:hypothetical protein